MDIFNKTLVTGGAHSDIKALAAQTLVLGLEALGRVGSSKNTFCSNSMYNTLEGHRHNGSLYSDGCFQNYCCSHKDNKKENNTKQMHTFSMNLGFDE